jgi:cyanophycin synthetase
VGVVLNVSADHLGLGGIHTVEQLADVKGVVAAVTSARGTPCSTPTTRSCSRCATAPTPTWCSSHARPGENPAFERHLARGGIAARVEDDTFVVHRGRLRIPIAAVRDVPLMMGGAARFQAQNVLAAILAAYVRGMRYDDIRAGLLTFFPSPSLTPGRLNLLRLGRRRVLVDYAHNAARSRGSSTSRRASRRAGAWPWSPAPATGATTTCARSAASPPGSTTWW